MTTSYANLRAFRKLSVGSWTLQPKVIRCSWLGLHGFAGFPVSHLVRFFRLNLTVKDLNLNKVHFVGGTDVLSTVPAAAQADATGHVNPLETVSLNALQFDREASKVFACLFLDRSNCKVSTLHFGHAATHQSDHDAYFAPGVFQTIFGPNSSVKRVVVYSECPLVYVNRILAAGMRSTLETFGFFMRSGSLPCADALVNFIPHMAMLKELKLAFPRGLSTEAKSRILGAVEQSTSIQAIDLDNHWNQFTGDPPVSAPGYR